MAAETFNQLVNRAIEIAVSERFTAATPEEARDLSLSITHLEDGRTRYNSSRYRRQNLWSIKDPDLDEQVVDNH